MFTKEKSYVIGAPGTCSKEIGNLQADESAHS